MTERRHLKPTLVRAAVMCVLRNDLGHKVEEVGASFDKHHSTVLHHTQKHKDRLHQDQTYREVYFYLREAVADIIYNDNTPAKPIIEKIKTLCDLSFTERIESGM